MPVRQVELEKFSVFCKRQKLTFSPGINVFIGENSTGKSHLMKLMYSMLKALYDFDFKVADADKRALTQLQEKLAGVFKPDEGQLGRLVHRRWPGNPARVNLTWGNGDNQALRFRLSSLSKMIVKPGRTESCSPPPSIFLPSREALAMYDGFISAYDNRELSIDETYYDLCKALSGSPLRGQRMEEANKLVDSLEKTIGGKVRLKGGRFHVRYVATGFGEIEAHLLAEGFRKLASIAYLIVNGSLTKNSILFWDEPEANLNPKLVTKVAEILRSLAAGGVQIFIASHDYLLTNELAMAANYELTPQVPIKFFGFKRTGDGSAVEVESADRLVDLKDNPILQEFADHYDREQRLVFPSSPKGGHNG